MNQQLRATSLLFKDLPKPRSDEDLYILTLLCFGKRSGLKYLSASGEYVSYEAEPKFDAMFSREFYKHYRTHRSCIYLYDYAAAFWSHCIGHLYCGGIARASYGQVRVTGHREIQRIESWEMGRRNKRSSSASSPLVRLARQLRDGKNREIRGIPVLISGRVDGAEAVSTTTTPRIASDGVRQKGCRG